MKDLYRKSALERIASPDQLDKAPKISSPFSWLILLALTVVVVITVSWSIWGMIPETISANGMVVASSSGTNTVYSQISGRVTAMYAVRGKLVRENSIVMTVTPDQGEPVDIRAGLVGFVSEIVAQQGDSVNANADLLRISPETEAKQVIVCYVPTSTVKKVELNMDAFVTLTSSESQIYGHMQGRIVNVDSYSTSNNSMNSVLGKDNNVAGGFTMNASSAVPVTAVTIELYPDIQTTSGYWWSNEKGRQQPVSNGSMCSVRIVLKEIAPIEKLFTKIKEVWGK